MIKRILMICVAVTAGAAGTALAQAQQGYPVLLASVYPAGQPPYPPGGYPADYRRASGRAGF